MDKHYCEFPPNFKWGCATASYQVEGAHDADGRKPSIWDDFTRQPGRIHADMCGDVSVDQYHKYKEDVQLMKWLGLKAYRFSISWSRVIPDGRGAVNEKGLDYYDRLVDELLANGIEPWPTLFHWDLPLALQKLYGGWQSKEVADDFAKYAEVVTKRLSDRVTNYFTVNELFCFTDLGYAGSQPNESVFPPGICLPRKELNKVRHNALLGHGKAVQAIRANAVQPVRVGMAENCLGCVPAIETKENIDAARKAMREVNATFLTAILEGAYTEHHLETEGADAPEFTDEEMAIIGSPLDFVGVNQYAPTYIVADPGQTLGYRQLPHPSTYPKLDMPWLFFGPQILYWTPKFLWENWNVNEIYVTENGAACEDKMNLEGEINDTDRVLYLREHLIHANRAVKEGIPLKGYFLWSLLDNFEWAWGYSKRFGIFYVNYRTLERTPKLSAKFYREVISKNAVG